MKTLTLRNIALFFLIVSIFVGVIGYLNQYSELWKSNPLIGDFYANITAELASIAITVLVIDTLNERRIVALEKQKLIFQMGSRVNSISREAIRELRQRGWLQDGSLHGASLAWSNLKHANIRMADLRNVDFTGAVLEGAHLQESNLDGAIGLGPKQFVQLRYLEGATLPDGTRYDGRYRLPAELEWVKSETNIDVTDPQQMASYYKVSLDTYLSGQRWADEFLEELLIEAEHEKRRHAALSGIENLIENPCVSPRNDQFLQSRQRLLESLVWVILFLPISWILVKRFRRRS